MLMFVLVSMLSCTNTVICDDYTQNVQNSATINITYRDHVTGQARSESDGGGRYGQLSRTVSEFGLVVHVRTTDDHNNGCIPPVTQPGERWIALVDRGVCKTTNQKIQNSAMFRNASAVVIYSEEENENEPSHKKQKEDIIYVFMDKQKGEQIAALVDNGTKVMMYLSAGHMSNQPYSAINKTSMLFLSISFIVLMIISLAWLVFYYIQRSRYTYAKQRLSRRLMSAAKKAITKMPLRTIRSGEEMETGFDLCAICIEGYRPSDVVRILPCKHIFHKSCIDPWLIEHRNCPICKIDILKAFGMQVYRSRDSTLNIETEVASTSFGYSEFIPPDSARDFDSDGVEIVRFQLAQIEYHSMTCHPPVCDADSEVETGASDELSSYDHLLENLPPETIGSEGCPLSQTSSTEPQQMIVSAKDQVPGTLSSPNQSYLHMSSVCQGRDIESDETEIQSLVTSPPNTKTGQQYS